MDSIRMCACCQYDNIIFEKGEDAKDFSVFKIIGKEFDKKEFFHGHSLNCIPTETKKMDYTQAIEMGSKVAILLAKGLSPNDILIFGSTARKEKDIRDVDFFVIVDEVPFGDSDFCSQYNAILEAKEAEPFLFYLLKECCGFTEDELPSKEIAYSVDIIFLQRKVVSSHKAWQTFNKNQRDPKFLNNAFKHLLRWNRIQFDPIKRIELIKEYQKR